MKITHEFRNDLLKRREVALSLTGEINSGYAHAGQLVADHFKVSSDVVVIRRVENMFGSHSFLVHAFIYDSPAGREKIEPPKKEKKVAV